MRFWRASIALAALLVITSWVTYVRPASGVMHAQMQGGAIVHGSMHTEQQLCEAISATPDCAMGLTEHQSAYESLSVNGMLLLALLPLLILLRFAGAASRDGALRVDVSQHWLRWRLGLHKLIDPFARLLRAGIINSKEYVRA